METVTVADELNAMREENNRVSSGLSERIDKELVLVQMKETELQAYKQEVDALERQATALVVHDEASEEAALVFIAGCKTTENKLEEARKEKVQKPNEYVKTVNAAFKPFSEILERLRKATDQQRNLYLRKRQEAIDAANRKAIADAEAAKRAEERKAEEARQEADRLRKESEKLEEERIAREVQEKMDRLEIENRKKREMQAIIDAQRAGDEAKALVAHASLAAAKAEEEARALRSEQARQAEETEKSRLEKAAVKQDMKAETADSKAMLTTPELVSGDTKGVRQLESGAKVGTRKTVSWAFTNGMSIEGDYYQDDARVQEIPARYFKLDLSKLGKDVKNGNPIPGTIKLDGFATTTRKG